MFLSRSRAFLTATALLGVVAVSFSQSIQTNSDLTFGRIAAGSAPGTVTISPLGSRTSSGGVTLASSSFGAARFTVSGNPNLSFAILLPATQALTGGGEPLVVDTFQSFPSETGILDGSGNRILELGATIHIPANQARGTYSGSFEVTVTYN
jgi:hypothetical protein